MIDTLSPTQYLVIDALSARHALGYEWWTFPPRINPTMRVLEDLGLIDWVWDDCPVGPVRSRLTRTRNNRKVCGEQYNLRQDILEMIRNGAYYPGYYSDEKTAILRTAIAVLHSWDKHVDGYRIDGELRYHLMTLSPWKFTALIGDMIDAGVTNVGEGEKFFQEFVSQD